MEMKNLSMKKVIAQLLFVSSVCVLAIKLLTPSPIQVSLDGSEITISHFSGVFTYLDCVVLVASSFLLGTSGMYLLFFNLNGTPKNAGEIVLKERKNQWGKIAMTLKDDEQKLYKALLDADGIVSQSALSEQTGISRSTVSRTLDLLESKGLVEKRRRGMGNIVLLK